MSNLIVKKFEKFFWSYTIYVTKIPWLFMALAILLCIVISSGGLLATIDDNPENV